MLQFFLENALIHAHISLAKWFSKKHHNTNHHKINTTDLISEIKIVPAYFKSVLSGCGWETVHHHRVI